MHPQILRAKPGDCPICGMELLKAATTANDDGSITLNASQVELANITTAPVRKQKLKIKTVLAGKVVTDEERIDIISSRVIGRIEKLFIKEVGQQIKLGDPLYQIYSEELLTLQQEYLLMLKQARESHDKQYESFLTASEKKLLLFGMTEEQIAQLKKLRSTNSRILFVAPASGVVTQIDAIDGQYVSEGSVLYRIEDLDHLWVEAELYPDKISLLKIGDQLTIQIDGFENDPIKSAVIFLAPEYRGNSQVITLRAAFDNSEGRFAPGMQASVTLFQENENVLVLPVDAVIKENQESYVWVQNEDGSFKMKMVKTGEVTSDEVEILQGLDENEYVVATGAYLLYSETMFKKGATENKL